MGTENDNYRSVLSVESPTSTGCSSYFDTNFEETKYKELKMSSKKLIRGVDFTFPMTEIINFWSCFWSFKIG